MLGREKVFSVSLILAVLSCKSLSNEQSKLNETVDARLNKIDLPIVQVSFAVDSGLFTDAYTNIRTLPSAESDKIAVVTNAQFELMPTDQGEAYIDDNTYRWHKIKLAQNTSSFGWLATSVKNQQSNSFTIRPGIFFTVGHLVLDQSESYNLRSNPSINAEKITTLKNSKIFDVLEVFDVEESGVTMRWYKVLLKNLPKLSSAYVAQSGNIKFNALPSVSGEQKQIPPLTNTCRQGLTQVGWLTTEQPVFKSPQVGPQLSLKIGEKTPNVFLPRGTKVKITPNQLPVNGFVAVEVSLFSKDGIEKDLALTKGYIKRSELNVSTECHPFSPDLINQGGYRLLGATDYTSSSKSARRTNIALALSRLDGQTIAPQEAFSFLERVVFPYEKQNIAVPQIDAKIVDVDQLGCPPGYVLNPEESALGLGHCRAYVPGVSTSLDSIYAGGICGVSTALHRAVVHSGLPTLSYHNHRQYYPGSYGLPDPIYGTPAGPGIDAEVFWNNPNLPDADRSGYRFLNDSRAEILVSTSIVYDISSDLTHGVIQFWTKGEKDREVKVSAIKILERDPSLAATLAPNSNLGAATCWKSEVRYLVDRPSNHAQSANIKNVINNQTRTQITQNFYAQDYKYTKNSEEKWQAISDTDGGFSDFAVDCRTNTKTTGIAPSDKSNPRARLECLPHGAFRSNIEQCFNLVE